MAKQTDFSRALAKAAEPKTGSARHAFYELTVIANRINPDYLSADSRSWLEQMVEQSRNAIQQVETEQEALTQTAEQESAKLKKANLIRKLIQWGLLVVIVVLLFRVWWLAIILFIAMMIGRSIAKKQLTKKAQQVARDSWGSAMAVASQIGGISDRNGDAYGICGQVDSLFLRSLPTDERALEIQQRQFRKQEMAAERRHQEQMAVAREQAVIQREQMWEARYQSGLARDSNNQLHQQTKIAHDQAYRPAKDRYNNPK